MMAKDRAQRPQSPLDLLKELEAIPRQPGVLIGAPAGGKDDPATRGPGATRRRPRRRRFR
jgi:hypothetical protein